MRRSVMVLSIMLLLAAPSSCGDDGDDGAGGGDAPDVAFELETSPEFVNMVLPGRRPVALVTLVGEGEEPVALEAIAALDGASVDVVPAEIAPGQVAEIWVEVPDTTAETPIEVTIVGSRGDLTRSVVVTATAMPGVDDLEPTARDIAAVFLEELGGTAGLPSSVDELVGGTPVAGLLVVTHYAWFTEEVEIGLGWHIMVAPDDWAELTVRPRGELRPTAAWRLRSWSTALGGGSVEIEEIPPPPEVTR